MSEIGKTCEFVCAEEEIDKVAINGNSAEITRKIHVKLEPRENIVIIKDLPFALERDSIRIDGIANATIHCVQIERQNKNLEKNNDSDTEEQDEESAELKKEIKAMLDEHTETKRKMKDTEIRRQLFNKVINEIKFGPADNKEALAKADFILNKDSLEALDQNIIFFAKKFDDLAREEFENEGKFKEQTKKLDNLRSKMVKLTNKKRQNKEQARITLESEGEDEVALLFIYRVNGAFWKPEYDIRIDDGQNLNITYGASISQNTGEDWKKAKILLSTAKPSSEYAIHNLPTLNAVLQSTHQTSLFRPTSAPTHSQSLFGTSSGQGMPVPRVGGTRLVAPTGLFGSTASAEGAQQDQSRPSIFGAASDNSTSHPRFGTATSGGLFGSSTVVSSTTEGGGQSYPAQSQPRSSLFGSVSNNSSNGQEEIQSRIRYTEANVISNNLNVEYETLKPATILNGNSQHKVILGQISLPVNLLHECIPAKYSKVFLFATGTNTSNMALLSGPANVYINKAFVSKICIPEIMPNEKFSMSLGTDSSVKVESSPVLKYHEQVGINFRNNKKTISARNDQ
ncbi:hypothetical protein WR25_21041 isoform C [Diploscapter pachys]|uniref:DUF4139 domain-containing protein n=1 Tax=Diploscapter pachys TaxID=2018661 RepID=A0A2A2KJF1_9BILA|nr:hypothetical protein WR25_21041 isoform A [Diploscapter pachys]PAV74114.1 hypothetical protein WR25_21041 isoform C [Diploscapter pachys]